MKPDSILNTDQYTKIVIKREDDDTVVAVITEDDVEPSPNYIAVLTPNYDQPFGGGGDRVKEIIRVRKEVVMYLYIKEIKDLTSVQGVNHHLKNGWVLINSYVNRRIHYVIGRPSEEYFTAIRRCQEQQTLHQA